MKAIGNFLKGLYPVYIYMAITFASIMVLVITIGIYEGYVSALTAPYVSFAPSESEQQAFINIVTDELTFMFLVSAWAIIVFFILIKMSKKKIQTDNRVKDITHLPILIIGAIATALMFNIIIHWSGIAKVDPVIKEVNNILLGGDNIFLSLVMTVVLAPIVEEQMFRYLSYESYRKSFSPKVAIILTSIVFGLFHGNITQGIYAFFLGLILAYAYEKTFSLLTVICMHAAANFVISILSITGTLDLLVGNIIISIACIPICAVIILFMLKTLKNLGGKKLEDIEYSNTVL